MANRMRLLSRLQYSQNWNVGFCEQEPDDLISRKVLNRVQWLKHPYKDRWYADPFIYKVTDSVIVVFVEECLIEHPKGILCELVVDRKTKRLNNRYVLLELDSHLSYPAIIQHSGKTYVYPENGASGKLNMYEYDEINHKLINPKNILDKAVADSTILERHGKFYLIASLFPDTQEKTYSFCSDDLLGPYEINSNIPFQISKEFSRPAGNWIVIDNQLFRPAQDCVKRYGAGISLMEVRLSEGLIQERCILKLFPQCKRYPLGIHTINFWDGLCVVDGYGYLYPFVGALMAYLRRLKHSLHV